MLDISRCRHPPDNLLIEEVEKRTPKLADETCVQALLNLKK